MLLRKGVKTAQIIRRCNKKKKGRAISCSPLVYLGWHPTHAGTIRVRIVREQRPQDRSDRVGVEIRDTGPGIPPELRGRVFDEFFRVRASRNGTNGNGLGLAISLRIARLLGGDVTYADNDGGGSVFTLWLPRAKEPSVN